MPWLSLPIASANATETQDAQILCNGFPDFEWIIMYLSTLTVGTDESVGSCGSSSLLFAKKVMVWHFLSNSHEVMTALIVMLPSSCGDFAAIS
jgi:hypothetical protein